jgi:hypothetical protein
MAPTASAASAAMAESATRSISGYALPGSPITASAPTLTLAREISAARKAVHRGVAAARDTLRFGVDQKQSRCQFLLR